MKCCAWLSQLRAHQHLLTLGFDLVLYEDAMPIGGGVSEVPAPVSCNSVLDFLRAAFLDVSQAEDLRCPRM